MKEKKWYEYNENEKVKNVYSKTTLQQFWNWWSNNENKVMEIRIKDFNLIKLVAIKNKLPYSASGIYINNVIQLKKVLSETRDKAVLWFGINPRKKNINKWGKKGFGGSDTNVNEIGFIFIDIDRKNKIDKPATEVELKDADILSDKILGRLEIEGWNKSYIKLSSGNGVQLLIKLDFPLKLPEVEFTKVQVGKEWFYTPILNNEFSLYKEYIRKGIGDQILRFSRKFKDELRVEIDKSGFNIGRVAALHCSKNLKYNDEIRWRGIIELKDGINIGLTDYILSKEEDIKNFKQRNVFIKSKTLNDKNRIKKGKMAEHKLIKFILNPNLPIGGGNNKLWFQVKCLIRDSKIDLNSEEFREFHKKLQILWKTQLASNLPTENFSFDENIVNSYCIDHCIPLIYDFWPQKKILRETYKKDILKWEHKNGCKIMKLDKNNTIQEDLRYCSNKLIEGDRSNYIVLGEFINGLISKYGEEKTQYYFNNLFDRAFNYI